MVLRSLCSPRKKQKVKMQMSRQTSDNRMPTHVMTSRSRSCMLSAFCGKRETSLSGSLNSHLQSLNVAMFSLSLLKTYMSHVVAIRTSL